jgi:hypothetical protein
VHLHGAAAERRADAGTVKHNDRRRFGSSGEEVVQVLAGVAEDVMRLSLEPPGGEPLDAQHLRRLLAVLEDRPGRSAATLREAVEACLARPGSSRLEQLARAVRATVSRPVRVDPGPPHRVLLRLGRSSRSDGPWLGYVLRRGGGACWLALGWRRADQAAAVLDALPGEVDDRYRPGPIETGTGAPGPGATVLLSVEYREGSLPAQHAMVNDLHAMVILHDLLREDARTGLHRET